MQVPKNDFAKRDKVSPATSGHQFSLSPVAGSGALKIRVLIPLVLAANVIVAIVA
jgi:hypothetical protein